MANCRKLLVIGLFLGVLHVFFMQPTYGIGRISERHVERISKWEKDSTELKGDLSRKLKEIPAKFGKAQFRKALVLTVAKVRDQGDFTTVQEAINAVPMNNRNPVLISIKPGIYREKVTIPAEKPFITLRGSDTNSNNTIITWNDSAKSSGGTLYSATVSVFASDFTAKRITIENSHGPGGLTDDDQAVALRIMGDRCAFYHCRFLGYQDTVLDESGSHYFRNCFIEGAVDFICGNGKSLYERCELHAIPIDNGAFTAQKRSSLSEDSGFVFLHCNLTGNGLMYLGRAWGPYSTVVFIHCYMADIIFPEGWYDWNEPNRERTVHYGQYKCSGPGATEVQRVPWAHELSHAVVAPFMSTNYIAGERWIW